MEKILNSLTIETMSHLVEGAAFKNALRKVDSRLLKLSTQELENQLHPTEVDYLLKNAFWHEIRKAAYNNQKVHPEDVFGGLCSYTHWFNNILNNPKKLAWLLSPCLDVRNGVNELKLWILQKVREILTLKLEDKDGNPNISVIKEVIKVSTLLFETEARGA